eukprot:5906247-Pyramimonas_sp.AAC.1
MKVVDGDTLTPLAERLDHELHEYQKEIERYGREDGHGRSLAEAKLVCFHARVIVQEAAVFMCFQVFAENPVRLRKGLIKEKKEPSPTTMRRAW